MALARLVLRKIVEQQRLCSPITTTPAAVSERSLNGLVKRWGNHELLKSLSTESSSSKAGEGGGKEVAVQSSEGKKKWRSLFPRRHHRKRSLWNWRGDNRDLSPSISGLLPSSIGNALVEAAESMSRLFESVAPSQLIGRLKEKDDHYKLKFEVPGLGKDDLKITVHNGVLHIRGEHKEEEGAESDDEYWSAGSYGYYEASLIVPDDAKADDIKAELKDGLLTIIIPKDEKRAKDVKEIKIQ
ncbi:hypothetical protein Ancab_012036 [Ancistrocladus abbreviatus]